MIEALPGDLHGVIYGRFVEEDCFVMWIIGLVQTDNKYVHSIVSVIFS